MRLNTFKMAAKCLYQAPHLQYSFCMFFFLFLMNQSIRSDFYFWLLFLIDERKAEAHRKWGPNERHLLLNNLNLFSLENYFLPSSVLCAVTYFIYRFFGNLVFCLIAIDTFSFFLHALYPFEYPHITLIRVLLVYLRKSMNKNFPSQLWNQ